MGDRQENEWERVRVEPKPACDGNVMRLNHVPTGQLTSARSSLTNPPGPFMPRPDANKENQGKRAQTHIQTDPVFMTTARKNHSNCVQNCRVGAEVNNLTNTTAFWCFLH